MLGFLQRIAVRDPHHLFFHIVDAPACPDWLLRAVAALPAPALHLGHCILSNHDKIAATATAFGPAGERRATFLSLTGLSALAETFGKPPMPSGAMQPGQQGAQFAVPGTR